MGTMTVKEAAELWDIAETRVTLLCREGRIEGARKEAGVWAIPEGTQKPADYRIKTGKYIKTIREPYAEYVVTKERLALPVGISDYRRASKEYYYVDKTLMIKDFLDERPMVTLFTRPRRFGKTLNMDMFRIFFEKTEEDTSVYFRDKKIWACGERYRAYQGKYPVIFLTFKDAKYENWDETFTFIKSLIRMEFKRHKELEKSMQVTDQDFYTKIVYEQARESDYVISLMMLSKMLDDHYGVKPIIIIDEYDTPIQQGYSKGFYEEVIRFMRNFFSGGLKDNRHLAFGFLTGILRVAQESIFSGLNNLKINSIMDNRYSEYFGFTKEEVLEMAEYYREPEKYEEICEWYDGYQFGKTEIFNPWSVINYFSDECEPKAFWVATGSNDIIGEVLQNADEKIYEKLELLLRGHSFAASIDTNVIYPQIRNNPSSVYSFLLMAGYLKIKSKNQTFNGKYMCELAIPNKEISQVYREEILERLSPMISNSVINTVQEALYFNDAEALQSHLQEFLYQTVSYFDTANEAFYHGLVLGLCAMMTDHYYVSSNRESGTGRYDIQLMPKKTTEAGILIEIKAAHRDQEKDLEKLAEEALLQIEERQYSTEMRERGIEQIWKYGVAFCEKNVVVKCS